MKEIIYVIEEKHPSSPQGLPYWSRLVKEGKLWETTDRDLAAVVFASLSRDGRRVRLVKLVREMLLVNGGN